MIRGVRDLRGAWLAVFVVGGAVGVACDGTKSISQQPAPESASLASGPISARIANGGAALDLTAITQRVHFAFRADAQSATEFSGADAHYAVSVSPADTSFVPAASATVRGSPLVLTTQSIARGSVALPSNAHALTLAGDGTLTRGAGAVVEHLQNTSDGLEQSWTFAERPDGVGDVVVRIAARGEPLTESTATGLHFADHATGLGARYGNVAWVDASGSRFEIAPRYVGGVIELRVPASVVDGSAFPAVLDPTLSPEIGTDTPLTTTSADDQQNPVVAFAAGTYLVTWQDNRAGNTDVYAARVKNGVVLDTSGLAITGALVDQTTPAVASDGTNFLIAWAEGGDVFADRISAADGSILGSVISVSTANGTQSVPAATYDGTDFVVAWQDTRGGDNDIYAARVATADGTLLDGPSNAGGIGMAIAAGDQTVPAIACDATRCLVVWQDSRSGNADIYGARFAIATHAIVDSASAGIPISTNVFAQSAPQVASDGANFFAVWQDFRTTVDNNIFGARIASATGTVIDGSGDSGGLSLCAATKNQNVPSIAYDATAATFIVAWQDARGANDDVWGERVDSTGTINAADATSSGVQITNAAGNQDKPRVSSDGTNALVVWQDVRNGNNDIFGARVALTTSDAGAALVDATGIAISLSSNKESGPAVAYDGSANYLLAWSDLRAGNLDIYGTRVRASDGTVLDTSGIVIANALTSASAPAAQQSPAIAFGGGNFFVAWQDARAGNNDIYGRRVSPADGSILDGASTAGIALITETHQQLRPQVAYSTAASKFLVVWDDQRSGDDIWGRRVGSDGSLFDGLATTGGISISTASGAQINPAVAANGTDFLVVWQDHRNGSNDDIFAATLTAASGAVGTLTTPASSISVAAGNQQFPAIAFGMSDYLVTWQDARGADTDVYAARIDATGADLDGPVTTGGIALSTATNNQTLPAVAYDGQNFSLAWTDKRSALTDIYGGRIRESDGALLDGPASTGGYIISNDSAPEDNARVATNGAGGSIVTYNRLSSSLSAVRVFSRLLSFFSTSTACTAASDCATGNCVDGVCCDTACGGTVTSDCQACSVTMGAAVDGTCATIAADAGYICRAAVSGGCDFAETCNGTGTSCPADVVADAGSTCGASGTCSGDVCILPDAGPAVHDAGSDAGVIIDSGVAERDASSGSSDGGGDASATDAGAKDAGSEGGAPDAGGCGCRVGSPRSNDGWMLALAGLGLLTIRRKSRKAALRSDRTKCLENKGKRSAS